jgi:hypothetical protein
MAEGINQIRMRILEDGTISINTDAFTEEAHVTAEELINDTIKLAGGEHKIVERKTPDFHHHHSHDHGHSHSH